MAQAEQIGSVDTVFKMFGPDHKIVVEAFDDPDVKTSPAMSAGRRPAGLKAAGLAEDTSDAAISCQQVGPVELSDKIKTAKRRATLYSRNGPRWCSKATGGPFYDAKRNTGLSGLLGQSRGRLTENAISAVPIMPWH